MRSLFFVLLVSTIGVQARNSGILGRRAAMPSTTSSVPSPTQAGMSCNCNNYYKVLTNDSCAGIVAKYNHAFTLNDFYTWNPAVGTNCYNLFLGYYVCIGVNTATPAICVSTNTQIASSSALESSSSLSTPISLASALSTLTSSGSYSIMQVPTSSTLTPSSTESSWPPTATQSGLATNCNRYYKVRGGDTCDTVRAHYDTTITLQDILIWNPALGSDCTNLFVNYWVCVGVPLQTSTVNTPSATVTTPSASVQNLSAWTPSSLPTMDTRVAVPSPTQSGLISNCQGFYAAQMGDTCSSIVQSLSYLTGPVFQSWNPALGSDCSGLKFGYYYCVENSTEIRMPPTVSGPVSPTQSGIAPSCTAYYLANPGLTCDIIVPMFGTFDQPTFFQWNPALNSNCSALVPGDYYCVGTHGTPTTPTSAVSLASTSTMSSSQIPVTSTATNATPTPIQSGLVSDCSRFYNIETGDTCYNIAQQAGIALSDFYIWNPAVKTDCSGLQAHVYVCIGLTGPPVTITSGTPVPITPSPVQTGMVASCARFYKVEAGDGCYNMAQQAGVAITDFYAWNPAVKADCSGLMSGMYVCIGLKGAATTITTGTPVAAASTSTA